MTPKKPLSEYTVAGLLFIGAHTRNTTVKSEVLAELRNRRKVVDARKEATERNRIEKQKLNIELEIEGVRSKNEQEHRKANRDLFAEMKDRAFEIVDIPEGLPASDTMKQYDRDIYTKAKELYNEFKQTYKKEIVKDRREKVKKEGMTYRQNRIAERKAKQIEAAAYQNARFPLIGAVVYYTDTTCNEKRVGTIRGFSYRENICAFVIRIESADGEHVGRTFPAIEPVDNVEWFNEVKASYVEFERYERLVKERDNLLLRVNMYHKRIAELDPIVYEYIQSDFRRNWAAADEVAKAFARDVRNARKGSLF